ncbi:GNAT family N-acetyltransferase [Fructilactobacillus sp. Tb1]|uniref:GNAT family N-acetyltransferase n=1 Tax=Fructilactobacillus sp. Tb1 TaxID=3422304 RepID=UPI003D287F03
MMIRSVENKDYKSIDKVIYEAFLNSEHGYNNENDLVHNLRKEEDYNNYFEIVAENYNNDIVGHAMLSTINISDHLGMALAPISVMPDYQNNGIGSLLMNEIEQRATKKDVQFISILGDPNYYGRFGYLSASKYRISAPFEVEDKYFMIKPLFENGLKNVTGTVEYNQSFN